MHVREDWNPILLDFDFSVGREHHMYHSNCAHLRKGHRRLYESPHNFMSSTTMWIGIIYGINCSLMKM